MTARNGIALFAALSTMAVVGLLVGGMVATATLAQRSSALTDIDAEISAAADFALGAVIDASLADLLLGVSQTVDIGHGSRIESTVSMTRLPRDVLWLVAESRMSVGHFARRRVNLVARWPIPPRPTSAITSRGNVRLGPQVVFVADSLADADCRAPISAPATVTGPSASVSSVNAVATAIDSAAADSATYLITASQRVRLDSLPKIIRVRGDTTIYSGRIDGILMIDGRLIIAGSVVINGLLLARSIDARTGRLDLTGALLAFDAPAIGQFAVDLGDAVIRYSRCAVAREWRRTVPLRPVAARGWAEIF